MSGSEPAPAPSASASVLDFLYHDARRVGSPLSQFEDEGLLQSLKTSRSVGTATTNKRTMGGEISVKVLRGQGGAEDLETSDEKQIGEKTYDPYWANALNFRDALEANDLIKQDIDSAHIGDFVLITGSLMVIDVAMLREVWRRPVVRRLVELATGTGQGQQQPNRAQRRAQPSVQSARPPSEAELAADLMDILPHTVQGWMISSPVLSCWFPLRQEALVTPPGDLMLNYGVHLGRQWQVLGILDAKPGALDADAATDVALMTLQSPIAKLLADMATPVREMLGRPEHAFGLTPLMIYRSLS